MKDETQALGNLTAASPGHGAGPVGHRLSSSKASRWRKSFASFPNEVNGSIAIASISLNLVLAALLAHAQLAMAEWGSNPSIVPVPVMLYDGETPSYRIPAFSSDLDRHRVMAMSEATSMLIDATRIEGQTPTEHYKRIGPEGPVRCRMVKEIYDQWHREATQLAERAFKTTPKLFRHVRNARPVEWIPTSDHAGQVAVEMDIVPVDAGGKERPTILVRTLVQYEYRQQTTENPKSALCNPSGFFVVAPFEEVTR